MSKWERRLYIYNLVYNEFWGGFPLKSAQDLSCTLNQRYWGLGMSPQEATGAIIKLKNEGLLLKRRIYGGIRPLVRFYDWRGEHIRPPPRTYWFFKKRIEEVRPMTKWRSLEQTN